VNANSPLVGMMTLRDQARSEPLRLIFLKVSFDVGSALSQPEAAMMVMVPPMMMVSMEMVAVEAMVEMGTIETRRAPVSPIGNTVSPAVHVPTRTTAPAGFYHGRWSVR